MLKGSVFPSSANLDLPSAGSSGAVRLKTQVNIIYLGMLRCWPDHPTIRSSQHLQTMLLINDMSSMRNNIGHP
jgi:hypothetical protein